MVKEPFSSDLCTHRRKVKNYGAHRGYGPGYRKDWSYLRIKWKDGYVTSHTGDLTLKTFFFLI